MREVRGEVGKKTPKKDMDNLSMLRRHMADFFRHFVQLQYLQLFLNWKLFIMHIKNNVIKYKWPMIGQYIDEINNGKSVYILIDQW